MPRYEYRSSQACPGSGESVPRHGLTSSIVSSRIAIPNTAATWSAKRCTSFIWDVPTQLPIPPHRWRCRLWFTRLIRAMPRWSPSTYGDADAAKYGERKPLIWFWMMYDRSPVGLNHWLGHKMRAMLAATFSSIAAIT